MNNRFRLSSNAALGLSKSSAPAQGLITEGIFDSNIDSETPGHIRIALWREWQAMLSDLRSVGPVWSIVRNGHCVLAVHGNYPKMIFSPDQQVAHARDGEISLTSYFQAWRHAMAFDSGCSCGRLYGIEIGNDEGRIFHRVCLSKETALAPFVEWVHTHQATGLEDEDDDVPLKQEQLQPPSFFRPPGTLNVSLDRLRLVLIHAAQREIPLVASVASQGITQTARIDILRASEAHGWLMLSGNYRSLYVESEPTGTLTLEPAMIEGETAWKLSLTNDEDHRLLHLQPALDGRAEWNQLIRDLILHNSTSEL